MSAPSERSKTDQTNAQRTPHTALCNNSNLQEKRYYSGTQVTIKITIKFINGSCTEHM